MKNEISENTKVAAAKAWFNNKATPKAEIARKFGISTRTLGRAIDKMAGGSEKPASITPEVVEAPAISYMSTKSGVTMFRDGKSVHIHCDNAAYGEVVNAILNGDLSEAWDISDTARMITKFSEGLVSVDDGVVKVGNFVVNNAMTDKLVDMASNDPASAVTFARFFQNLMNVSDTRVIEELYGFLTHGGISLNEDGSFFAYRAVSSDYLDKYTRTIDNSVGKVVEMPRSMVDSDKNRTCSTGLHFAAIEYVTDFYGSNYAGDRIVKVKIWPEDVVSIPTDYNDMKGRCCRYEVVEDVTSTFWG